jgi:hypothetical protein
LHIGKTGGTAVKNALGNYLGSDSFDIKLHKHHVTLVDIPQGEKVVFFLRDPITRFISGFYSRKRKGQPRIYAEWDELDTKVFHCFDTPNALAKALGGPVGDSRRLARAALSKMIHSRQYSYWTGDIEYFLSRLDDILFVGFQESLERDFLTLKQIVGLPSHCQLPNDDVAAHRSVGGDDKKIDPEVMLLLKNWYQSDRIFIALCRQIMASRGSDAGDNGFI